MGKNSSGSSSRHAERWRQSMAGDFLSYRDLAGGHGMCWSSDTRWVLWRTASALSGRRGTRRVLRSGPPLARVDAALRSEEHTPELQLRQYLVCRVLLE